MLPQALRHYEEQSTAFGVAKALELLLVFVPFTVVQVCCDLTKRWMPSENYYFEPSKHERIHFVKSFSTNTTMQVVWL